jgi:hypothetical protein
MSNLHLLLLADTLNPKPQTSKHMSNLHLLLLADKVPTLVTIDSFLATGLSGSGTAASESNCVALFKLPDLCTMPLPDGRAADDCPPPPAVKGTLVLYVDEDALPRNPS